MCESSALWLIISEMTDPIWVKLSGIVKGGWENDLTKELSEKLQKEKSLSFWQTL